MTLYKFFFRAKAGVLPSAVSCITASTVPLSESTANSDLKAKWVWSFDWHEAQSLERVPAIFEVVELIEALITSAQ